ncbi:MAG: glycosyltransferase [Candidatus Micrarchaeaceae archaeon]
MNICMLSMKGNFNKNIGQGVQTYTYQIYQNVALFAPRTYGIDKIELGFGSNPLARKISFTISTAFHDFSKYDIVHMPCPIMYNPRCKAMVTTLHELFLLSKNHPLRARHTSHAIADNISAFIGKKIMEQISASDYLMANSTQTALEARSTGYPRDRIFIVNLAIDNKFTEKPLRNKANKNRTFRIGYLGGMHARKNVAFAIKAFSWLEGNYTFELWGNNPSAELQALASGDKRVKFKGFASERHKLDIYDSFDALVFPSYYEGFGLEVLEAQSRGLPVVIYKKAIIPKEVRKYCFEAEDESHMAQIISDIKLNGYSNELRNKATVYARSFTWKRCAEETIAAYKDIMKRK